MNKNSIGSPLSNIYKNIFLRRDAPINPSPVASWMKKKPSSIPMKVKEMERSTGVAWILTSPRSTGRHQGWVLLQHGFCRLWRSGFFVAPFGGKVVATGESSSDIKKQSHIGKQKLNQCFTCVQCWWNMLGTSDLKDSKDHWCNVQPLCLWVKSKYQGVMGIYLL